MKISRRSFLRYVLPLLLLLFAGTGNVEAQERYYKHTVQAGETLYRLSVKYGVTVEQILAANPKVREGGLKADAEVLIPVVPHADGPAGTDCRVMHKVKRKETLWRIAQEYGVTVEALLKANPDVEADDKLKKGSFLCIPYAAAGDAVVKPQARPEGYAQLDVAVVLPMLSGTVEARRSVEFYRGVLMAVAKMKTKGTDIRISAYDEPASGASMSALLDRIGADAPQLLIGPLYPGHFDEVAAFAARHRNTKWLLPFSSKYDALERTPNVFLLNAPDRFKARFVAELFLKSFPKSKVVFLHEQGGNELMFSADLRNLLVAGGCEVSDLTAGYTADQMGRQLSAKRRTIFVPEVSTAEGAKAVMAKALQLREAQPRADFALLAYPEWTTSGAISRDDLHRADTYVFMNYFYNPFSAETRRFTDEYASWFKTPLLDVSPRMYLLGYDAGLYVMTGLKTYGRQWGAQSLSADYYQSALHFRSAADAGGYVNDCMYFIHYRPSGVIDKISQ